MPQDLQVHEVINAFFCESELEKDQEIKKKRKVRVVKVASITKGEGKQ